MTTSPVSRFQISTARIGFLLIGMASGAWGVLLPDVSAYYHVGRSVVGLLFFASATGYAFLIEHRGANVELAGGIVSGYWLGSILGRFILNFLIRRVYLSFSGQMNTCLIGIISGLLMIWFIPSVIVCTAAFFMVGAFLGPVYPSTVALLPDIVKRGLIESAMGFLLSIGILGGALFPWVAGTLAQYRGIGSLAPYALSLTVVMLALWCAMRRGLQDLTTLAQ